jgi:hypothetical protein
MWNHVQKMLSSGEGATPPSIPLRKPTPALDDLAVGKVIRFSRNCPLAPLTNSDATVIAVRYYRFGTDAMKSYQLAMGGAKHFYLTVAEDDQGQYLGISRSLNELEQESWFGVDALSFFTEASSAKSIRCKVDLMIEGEWAAARYAKSVDWVEGSISPNEAHRLARSIRYSLLVNEAGDKALEIEHENASDENRFFITVYRPIEDIETVDSLRDDAPSTVPANDDIPLFKEPMLSMPQPKQRMDFRRLDEPAAQIHIERTPVSVMEKPEPEAVPELPAFLLARGENYLSLDEVIPPETEQVRVGLATARYLIEHAIHKNVRVRDVLRDLLGLKSALSEEVIFEMPLSDEDYRMLAMRYKLRPDHRVEIRSRLEEELCQKLTGIAKA